jgi:hypothetical protein
MKLQEVLYEIKVNGETLYLKDLINNLEVHDVILNAHRRHKCKNKILEDLVRDYTLQYYQYSEDFTIERYLNGLKKFLGRKARMVGYDNEEM